MILLFHDSLGSVEQWRDFPEKLAAQTGLTTIAYDRLGFGRSDAHPGLLGKDFVFSEAEVGVSAVRETFEMNRMILAGHSVGGGMSIATAAAFPGVTSAVITMAAQAFIEDRTLNGIIAAKNVFNQPGQIDRLVRYHGDKARWVLDAWTETWLSPIFANWNLDDALRRVQCPILAISGDRDEYCSLAQVQRIAAMAKGPTTIEVIEDCGHVVQREKPDTVLNIITTFISRLDLAVANI
ncbi:MAG: alpha/beta hydrolase [Cyanobacteria bacterium SZAS-4]|nr:alpha/beta hydrolase [Cyanobacteria bacterium SZAS-4]